MASRVFSWSVMIAVVLASLVFAACLVTNPCGGSAGELIRGLPHPGGGAVLRDMGEVGGTSSGRACGAEFEHDGDPDSVVAHYEGILEADRWEIRESEPFGDLVAIRDRLWFDLVVDPEGGYRMRVEER